MNPGAHKGSDVPVCHKTHSYSLTHIVKSGKSLVGDVGKKKIYIKGE